MPEGSTALCECEPGYARDGEDCATEPTWTCDGKHEGGDADSAEPDECPPLARPLLPTGERSPRSIYPAQDEDWFALETEPAHVYRFSAKGVGEGVALLVEVFDASGTRLLGQDATGRVTAEVLFRGPTHGPAMARVRALQATVFDYDAWLEDVGVDDFPNEPAEAVTVAPGTTIYGALTYPADVDVIGLRVPAETAVLVRLLPRADGPTTPALGVTRDDGAAVNGRTSLVLADPADRTYLLVVRSVGPNPTGVWTLSATVLGHDDLPDVREFAQPYSPGTRWERGVFDRPDDNDVLRFDAQADHCYLVAARPFTTAPGLIVVEPPDTAPITSDAVELSWCARHRGGIAYAEFTHSFAAGGYFWRVEDLGQDDYPDAVGAGQPLAFGVPLSGRLEDDLDVDVFQVDGTAGHILHVALSGADASAVQVQLAAGGLALPLSGGRVVLPVSARWTIAVRAADLSSHAVRAYELEVTDEGVDDNDGTQPTPIRVSEVHTGATQYPGDVDCFWFSASGSRIYRTVVVQDAIETSAMRVSDAAGVTLASLPNTRFVPRLDGPVHVCVTASANSLGPYRLEVLDDGPEDHGALPGTSTAYSTLGVPAPGVLATPQDVDVFRLEAVAQHLYRVHCDTPATTGCSFTLTNEQGTDVRPVAAVIDAPYVGSATEPWFVMVSTDYLGVEYAYELTVDDLGIDDLGNTPATASRMVLGTQLTGRFDYPGDVDSLLVTDTANHVFEADCAQASGPCWLSATAGVTNDLALGPGPIRWLGVGSDVVLQLRGLSDPVGPWVLNVTDLGPDDYTGVAPLAVGSPTTGALQWTADADRFSFQVPAEGAYRVRCDSTTAGVCTLDLQENRTGGLWTGADATNSVGAEIAAWLNASNTFTLTVGAGAVGGYTLNVDPIPDDFGNTRATGTSLQPGAGAVQGSIEYPGDLDVFLVDFRSAGAGPRSVSIQGTGVRATVRTPSGLVAATATEGAGAPIATPVIGVYVITVSTVGVPTPAAYTLTVN